MWTEQLVEWVKFTGLLFGAIGLGITLGIVMGNLAIGTLG